MAAPHDDCSCDSTALEGQPFSKLTRCPRLTNPNTLATRPLGRGNVVSRPRLPATTTESPGRALRRRSGEEPLPSSRPPTTFTAHLPELCTRVTGEHLLFCLPFNVEDFTPSQATEERHAPACPSHGCNHPSVVPVSHFPFPSPAGDWEPNHRHHTLFFNPRRRGFFFISAT